MAGAGSTHSQLLPKLRLITARTTTITSTSVQPGPPSPAATQASPRADDSDVGCGFVLALAFLAANWLLVLGGKSHVPSRWIDVVAPIIMLCLWYYYSSKALETGRHLARLTDEKNAAEAKLEAFDADLGAARAELAAAAQAMGTAQGEIASLSARVDSSGRELSAGQAQGAARIAELEALVADQQADITRLRTSNATYEQREQERTTWRTLPQGYDHDAERFAATIANALR